MDTEGGSPLTHLEDLYLHSQRKFSCIEGSMTDMSAKCVEQTYSMLMDQLTPSPLGMLYYCRAGLQTTKEEQRREAISLFGHKTVENAEPSEDEADDVYEQIAKQKYYPQDAVFGNRRNQRPNRGRFAKPHDLDWTLGRPHQETYGRQMDLNFGRPHRQIPIKAKKPKKVTPQNKKRRQAKAKKQRYSEVRALRNESSDDNEDTEDSDACFRKKCHQCDPPKCSKCPNDWAFNNSNPRQNKDRTMKKRKQARKQKQMQKQEKRYKKQKSQIMKYFGESSDDDEDTEDSDACDKKKCHQCDPQAEGCARKCPCQEAMFDRDNNREVPSSSDETSEKELDMSTDEECKKMPLGKCPCKNKDDIGGHVETNPSLGFSTFYNEFVDKNPNISKIVALSRAKSVYKIMNDSEKQKYRDGNSATKPTTEEKTSDKSEKKPKRGLKLGLFPF